MKKVVLILMLVIPMVGMSQTMTPRERIMLQKELGIRPSRQLSTVDSLRLVLRQQQREMRQLELAKVTPLTPEQIAAKEAARVAAEQAEIQTLQSQISENSVKLTTLKQEVELIKAEELRIIK